MEENADAKGGGVQRRTLTLRMRAEMDADIEEDDREEDWGEIHRRITEEDEVRHWCRGGGERRRTLALRRRRAEEDAGAEEDEDAGIKEYNAGRMLLVPVVSDSAATKRQPPNVSRQRGDSRAQLAAVGEFP